MAIWRPENGDIPEHLVVIDLGGSTRRFRFDDQFLPLPSQSARRAAVRLAISDNIRRQLEGEGIPNIPAGNLLDITSDGQGWRAF